MTTTFDGLAFGMQTDGMVALPTRELVWSSEHIPFSDSNVNDSGGLGPLKLHATLILDIAALASWRARLGLVKTLIVDDVDYGLLRLVALGNIRKTIRPSPSRQVFFVDAEFSA